MANGGRIAHSAPRWVAIGIIIATAATNSVPAIPKEMTARHSSERVELATARPTASLANPAARGRERRGCGGCGT